MTDSDYELIIGTKAWSSWSLRPWIAMRRAAIPFREVPIALRQPDSATTVARHSPSAQVPALRIGGEVVWDSLAILETLAERHPAARLWPADPMTRARGRAIAAEMHAGFQPLRQHCPMDFNAVRPMAALPDPVAANVQRIVASWRECRRRYSAGGPFLLGAFSIADAMYAPVVSRLHTYVPDLRPYGDDGICEAYVDHIWSIPEMTEWGVAARRERP